MAARLLLVGCGKMGGALLTGWLRRETSAEVLVVEPNQAAVPQHANVISVARGEDLPADSDPDWVVLAVKPQVVDTVVPQYARFARPGTAFLSIIAGRTLDGLLALLGGAAAIVRAMPNTPAAIGRGITVAVANAAVSPAQRHVCSRLLQAGGVVEWVEDEALLDAVTAVSGGGPAYVFLLIETLAKSAERLGMAPDLAERLARETVVGAGALASMSPEHHETLRRNVTSPQGVTEAALSILMAEDGLQQIFDRALAAGTKRSRELSG